MWYARRLKDGEQMEGGNEADKANLAAQPFRWQGVAPGRIKRALCQALALIGSER